jgi:hypothetical protein
MNLNKNPSSRELEEGFLKKLGFKQAKKLVKGHMAGSTINASFEKILLMIVLCRVKHRRLCNFSHHRVGPTA